MMVNAHVISVSKSQGLAAAYRIQLMLYCFQINGLLVASATSMLLHKHIPSAAARDPRVYTLNSVAAISLLVILKTNNCIAFSFADFEFV